MQLPAPGIADAHSHRRPFRLEQPVDIHIPMADTGGVISDAIELGAALLQQLNFCLQGHQFQIWAKWREWGRRVRRRIDDSQIRAPQSIHEMVVCPGQVLVGPQGDGPGIFKFIAQPQGVPQ